jgi:L-asparaginase
MRAITHKLLEFQMTLKKNSLNEFVVSESISNAHLGVRVCCKKYMQRLALIQTGGTIASRVDAQGQLTPSNAVDALLEELPQLRGVELEVLQPFNLPSPHITPQHMLELRDLVHQVAPHVDGVVITHGTDTLEETAFYLHLTLDTGVPVVVTGSMRHALEASWDGPGNVLAAAHVALERRSRGRGALVVFAGDIFDARTVTKTHTTTVEAFGGYPGPIGRIDFLNDSPILTYFARPEPRVAYGPSHANARVEVLYAYAGWRGEGLREALERADGVVIAALGTGNVPPGVVEIVRGSSKPVVIATRTHTGPILPLYGYEGGGQHLREAGAIAASFLNAHKARILLIVLLSLSVDRATMMAAFDSRDL